MKFRKTLSLLLVLAMIISTAPVYVQAAAESNNDVSIQEDMTPEGTMDVVPEDTTDVLPDESGAPADANEEEPAVRTIMMYICGSNLETYSSMATYNIRQILESKFSSNDKVKFIIMTGGSDEWHTPSELLVDPAGQSVSIDPEYNQIWEAKGADAAENPGKMVLLEREGLNGVKARDKEDEEYVGELMSDPELLKGFINYCAENYPAEKYDLILWDHGSGPLGGFATDEASMFREMDFDEILDAFSDNAVTRGGGKFDFINFDACLMGSVELTLAFADYTDYYIASPELIPGYGEYYTGWLNQLGEEPNYDTFELGKKIVDDYIDFYEDESSDGASQEGTLAVINMDKLLNYYGFSETLRNLPTYLKQQATELNPELGDILFYDEFDSGKNSISYGENMNYYDLGTLASQLSFDFKELTPGDVNENNEVIDANIYTEPLANLIYLLSESDMIYARGTKGIRSKPLYHRDIYGKTNYDTVGTSGLYLYFPRADNARGVSSYFDVLGPIIDKLDKDVEALESEKEALYQEDPNPEDPAVQALDQRIRNAESRIRFLDDYRHALLDYALISKTGYGVTKMLDEGRDRSEINFNSIREYYTEGATYDPSIEDIENEDYMISDWNMEFMRFLLIRAGKDGDAPFSEHAAAEEASREWLNDIITQQAEENISRKDMTLLKTKDGGYRVRMKDTQKRVVEDVRYNITAHIPAAEEYIDQHQDSEEFALMFDEEKEDFISAKIGHVSGSPVLEKNDGKKVDQNSTIDYLDWYLEPGGTWELPPLENSWYTVSDADGYSHVANFETDEETGQIYFYGNYKSENGIDTLCCLAFDDNGNLDEILLGTEDGDSYRRIPASELVGEVEVMPIRKVKVFVYNPSIPLSKKPIIVSPETVGSIKLVKKDLNDIEDLKTGGKAAINRFVAVRDIYGYEITLNEEDAVDPSVDPAPTPAPSPAPSPAPGSDPNQKGKDGTPAGAGASAACVDKAITSSASEEGPAGTKYAPLKLKSTKQTKTSVKLTWTKAKGAAKYVVYGNACGKKNKMKKIAETNNKTFNVKKIGKKLKRGTYYKFIVVALDSSNNVVSTSKVIHAATKGGKVKNPTKVTVKSSVVRKAKSLRKGKSLKLNAKQKGSKVKKHRAISYESTDPKIATVSKKGVVKGKKKGTCYIYAYAQNGVYKKIKVKIK